MMASSARRIKQVTDPLDDRVKARLVGVDSYASSGSKHSAATAVAEDDSPCLSELVHGFLEDDHGRYAAEQAGYNSDDSDRVDSNVDTSDSLEIIRQSTATNRRDSYWNLLAAHVLKAMERLSFFKTGKAVFRRKVMVYLREAGHDAAICKTKWSSSGGLTEGNYEFIDVVQSASQNRYFVDLDFASEFEIARPTSEYSRLLQYLPKVFVGKSEELKRIVRVMSDSARRSLKGKELSISPWRKNRYMQNRWFGPYRRTTNPFTASSISVAPATIHAVNVVECRYVGFDDALNGRLFVRTR